MIRITYIPFRVVLILVLLDGMKGLRRLDIPITKAFVEFLICRVIAFVQTVSHSELCVWWELW